METKLRLDTEEQELLLELLSGDNWRVLNHYFEYLVTLRQQDVIRYNIEGDNAERELYLRKARSEGANLLLVDIQRKRDFLKKEKQKAKATRKP